MTPGQNKVCPQCGQHVPIDAQHCPFCGHAFRTQFMPQQAPPGYGPMPQQYPPPNVVYVPVPMGPPYPGQPYPRQNRQLFVKWLIGLVIAAILGVLAFAVIRSKMPARSASSEGTLPIVPTDIFNNANNALASKVLIHWETVENGQAMGTITNEGSQVLPNLYVQYISRSDNGGQWSDPYQITAQVSGQTQDAVPPNQAVSFTLPVAFTDIERIHVYYVDNTPAGPVQYALGLDQTQDR